MSATQTPGKLALRVLKLVLDTHVKLDPRIASIIPDEAWSEIEERLRGLQARIDLFIGAR